MYGQHRILREIDDIIGDEKSSEEFVRLTMVGNDILHWKGKILGPVSLILLSIERYSI